jgi:hypothetical protein
MLAKALEFFFDLRSPAYDLRKPPSTAEFLAFVSALALDPAAATADGLTPELARRVLATLVKAPEDQLAASRHPLLASDSAAR